MLDAICAEIKNYFTYKDDRHIDDWTIANGVITPSIEFATDYFRIIGSRLNDGVHKVSDLSSAPLKDETFHGAIWVMSPPADFLELAKEIEEWQEANGGSSSIMLSPFTSESFGGYSYTKSTATSSSGKTLPVPTWQSTYSSRLNRYRRIREL